MTIRKRNYKDPELGKVIYNKSIVKGIILLSVGSVDGVASSINKRGEKISAENLIITNDKDGICVEIEVKVFYNYNIPNVAYNIQQSIKHNVESMSKYKISRIDVHVVNVEFDDNTDM